MNSITYKEDIVRKMSEETGIPEKELLEIVNMNISYIKRAAIEKDFVMISLPNLCKIRLNYRLASNSVKNTKSVKKLVSLRKKIEFLKSVRKKYPGLMNFNKPLFERLWRKSERKLYVSKIYVNMYSMIRQVEEKTNEIIMKIS